MAKIINFEEREGTKRKAMSGTCLYIQEPYRKIIEKIKSGRDKIYSLEDIEAFANEILECTEDYPGAMSTPVIKIISDFGIKVYRAKLEDSEEVGRIYVGGTTERDFGYETVILVDKEEELFHQRFVASHEFGHYLFDYLTDEKYDDKDILFMEKYTKNHNDAKEIHADRFAAELLMPKELFIQQYSRMMELKGDRLFTVMYLSKYFKTKISSVEKRIEEVLP